VTISYYVGWVMAEYKVGQAYFKDNEHWLIHRIIDSKTIFEDTQSHEIYVMDELYLELRNNSGDIAFTSLREHKEAGEYDAEAIEQNLHAPDTLEWRKLGRPTQ
jgi:hypothetical protein